jgi:hypothetical protein
MYYYYHFTDGETKSQNDHVSLKVTQLPIIRGTY